jgi:Undecaprenyl-phosphate glucose phosphotransferase
MFGHIHLDMTGPHEMKPAHHPWSGEVLYQDEATQVKKYADSGCISTHIYSSMLVIFDVISFVFCGMLPAVMYVSASTGQLADYTFVVLVASVIFLLSSQALGVYIAEYVFNLRRLLSRGVLSVALTFSILMAAGIAMKISEEFSRVWFFSWLGLSLTLHVCVRVWLSIVAEAQLAKGACLQRAFIIACGENALSDEQLRLETRNRIRAVGAINVRSLENLPDATPYLRQLRPEIVILILPWSQVGFAMSKLKVLSEQAVEVLVLPQANHDLQKVLRLRRIGSQTMLQISEPPLAGWDQVVKRVEDVIIATFALVILSPLMALTALALRLESRGPILFKQMRIGFNGELIQVWKFRSMRVDNTDADASRQTRKNDPRVTRVGRIIRQTSIDELPQFWNVLQGQMSVVGPRPHALKTSADGEALEAVVDRYASRHRVKPGITGWAQVNGARGELRSRDEVRKRVDYDLHYIENWSIFFDIKIILMTIARVPYDPRAY